MSQWTTHLTQLGLLTSHPAAFVVVVIYGVLWAMFQPERFDFHAVATLVIWIMTLFIERSGRRDTLAIHAKLDELLRVDQGARTDLAELDDDEPEEIEQHRAEMRKRR